MKKSFVVSDIHGMYDHFIKLLEFWDRKDKLVILGDMIDRGKDSLKVVQHAIELSKDHDVTVLKGNHDQMLIDFIENPNENGSMWDQNGGNATLRSFSKGRDSIFYLSYKEQARLIQQQLPSEIIFLRNLPHFYEFGKVLFTHAGFNSWVNSWEETTDEQFVWIRDHYKHKNKSGYVNVFGHTPTQLINKDKSNDIWISQDKSYIGIDGACAYGGQLNGLLIDENGKMLDSYKIK